MNKDTYDDNLRERSHSLYCINIRLANWIKSHSKCKCHNSDYFNIYLSSGLHQFYTSIHKQNLCLQKTVDTVFQCVLFRCVGSLTMGYMMYIQTSSLLLSWNLVIFAWSSVKIAAKHVPLAPCVSEKSEAGFSHLY